MKTATKALLLLFLFTSTLGVKAQQKIDIDLAKNQNSELTQSVEAEIPIKITLLNRLLNTDYTIKVEKQIDLLEELAIKKDSIIKPLFNNRCEILSNKVDSLYSIIDEKKLGLAIGELQLILEKIEKSNETLPDELENCNSKQIFEAKYTIDLTKHRLLPQTLKKGESLMVTISRKIEGKEDEYIVWKRKYTTKKRGKWLTTYGFTYITQTFKESEPFFSKQNDTIFTVTSLNKRSKLSFVPSIFFTWFPYDHIDQDFSLSFTGGIGYDLKAPTAFIGGNLLYNQNIGISFGMAAHQQEFLNGRYTEGDILSENLESDQLNEKLYTLNPYISISFRFGAAPIKSAASSGSADD